ncbi:hypothetical protein DM813_18015 [Pseudomonas alkylphenolica]|uniref:DUF2513 domain-containing protein n=1 Tax=Pseudomonas alkylphenolica TaxID=237609 RepID=A0A443ZPU5_9PSED|nr:DUF2513 domain-containing protein [Pseudomonas alkylphenolica]RWU21100.1 hypothetical protein DM813_18015 [Pseudomonas alkylphenolica]
MKRDNKLVFDVLAFIESTDTTYGPTLSEVLQAICSQRGVREGGDAEEVLIDRIIYHLDILETGNLVTQSADDMCDNDPEQIYYQLTWTGHDQLDALRMAGGFR